jgi:hypothetical protein
MTVAQYLNVSAMEALVACPARSERHAYAARVVQLNMNSFGVEISYPRAILLTVVKLHPHNCPHTLPTNGVRRGTYGLQVFEKFGSSGRTRTYNPSVNSRMLYH